MCDIPWCGIVCDDVLVVVMSRVDMTVGGLLGLSIRRRGVGVGNG